MSNNLPPGVTDSMLDPEPIRCSTCGAEMFWEDDKGERVTCLNCKEDTKYHDRQGKEENN